MTTHTHVVIFNFNVHSMILYKARKGEKLYIKISLFEPPVRGIKQQVVNACNRGKLSPPFAGEAVTLSCFF